MKKKNARRAVKLARAHGDGGIAWAAPLPAPEAKPPVKRRGRPPLDPQVVAQRAAQEAARAKRAAHLAAARAEAAERQAAAARVKARPVPVAAPPAKAIVTHEPPRPEPAFWRASDVAKRYSVSTALVFKLIHGSVGVDGKPTLPQLPHRRIGRSLLIPVKAAKAYFEGEPDDA